MKSILAANLGRIRKDRGFTQLHLAKRSGVTLRTVQEIEQERVWPKPETLEKLVSALDTTVADLLTKVDPGKGKGKSKQKPLVRRREIDRADWIILLSTFAEMAELQDRLKRILQRYRIDPRT